MKNWLSKRKSKDIGNKWKNFGSIKSGNGQNFGSHVKAGGPNYNV